MRGSCLGHVKVTPTLGGSQRCLCNAVTCGFSVDLRGVEPLTSPVREKQSSIRLPAQTSDFPAHTADSTFINDHELPPVRTSDDDQMMTKLQQVAVADYANRSEVEVEVEG